MKVAMILPIFSEHYFRDYLGINLIVKSLEQNKYQVDCIDLNEKLVDFLLSDTSVLARLFSDKARDAGGQESPHSKYFELYLSYIVKYDTAQSLKENDLYGYFFKNLILHTFYTDIFQDESALENYRRILDSKPILDNFFTFVSKDFRKKSYGAVLVSVPHNNQLIPGLLFSKTLKTIVDNTKVIFGGSTITLMNRRVLEEYKKNGFFDYYIKYAGEEKLSKLLDDFKSKNKIDQAVLSKKAYVDINSQTIAFRPEYNKTSVPVLYSRGCYWGKCSYCTYIYLDSGKFTRKRLEVLLSELEQFSGKPVRISLITESLTPHDARIIAEGILERNIKVYWGSFIRVNTGFDASLFSLLRKSGAIFSCVGVESVNDKILDFLNKGYLKKDVYTFFQAAKDAKYRFFQVNFIHGSPVADLSDELDNIAFISEFRDVIGNIAFFNLEITKQSYLGKNLKAFNINVDYNSSRKAIRVDNIPFLPSLNEKEVNLVERSYEIAGEYFIRRDIKSAIKTLSEHAYKILSMRGEVLFEHNDRCYLGSMRSPLMAEISKERFIALKSSEKLQVKDFLEEELFQLFELKILNTDEIFWDKSEGAL